MLVYMDARPLGVAVNKHRLLPQTRTEMPSGEGLSPKRKHDKELVKLALEKRRNPLMILPKWRKSRHFPHFPKILPGAPSMLV